MTKKSQTAKLQRTTQPRLLLEQRIVFDAAMAATGTDLIDKNSSATEHTPPAVAHDTPVEAVKDTSVPVKVADDHRGEADASVVGKAEPVVITFIDSSVENIQAAIVGYPGEVIVLKAGQDGMDQIAAALAGRTNVSAIHIISHGSAGELELGTGVLNSFTMAGRYTADMEAIKAAMSENGDILMYGCDVAADSKGAAFMAQMARVTGADIEASTDGTGSSERGGNWTLESRTGTIETSALRDTAFDGLLSTPANNGDGALLMVSGNIIYSVDVATGKAFILTTVPTTVGGITVSAAINSLAIDHVNGLIYYTDGAANNTNLALFAFDYVNNVHILIDNNMTDNGAGKSIFGGQRGVGSGSATFANGTLYFGVEQNKTGTTNNANGANSTIYAITFTGGGKVMNTVVDLVTVVQGDWGDIGYDVGTNTLVSFSSVNGTTNTFTRYNPTTGAVVSATTASAGPASSQLGETNTNKTYYVTNVIQQYNANTTNGALIGVSIGITNAAGTAIATASDAAGYTPATGVIGDKIFFDNNNNGVFDGTDVGAAGVTVQLIKDSNNNGVVDAGETILATDTTDANGDYLFTNVLPGNYIVRVTDTGNVLGVSAAHPYTQTGTAATRGDADLATIGGSLLTIDFGVRNTAPVVVNDTATTLEDNVVTFDPRTNDSDADGDALTIRQVNGTAITAGGAGVAVTGGVVTLNAAGTLTFTPTANFNGTSTFSYQIADRTGTTTSGSITVTVTSVNDAPSGTSTTLTAVEDTARTFTAVDFGFTDVNDSPANTLQSVVITTLPANGTIRLNGVAVTAGQDITLAQLPQLTYTAAANANGNAYSTFTFQVRDNGGTTNGGVNLDPTPKTITFNVTAVNDAPTQVVPATYSTNEDTGVKISGVSVADIDANGGVETITLTVASGTLTALANGGVTVAGSGTSSIVLTGTIANLNTYLSATATQPTFNPVANFNGTVLLTVTTDDGGNTGIDPGTSGTATSEAVTSTSTITVVSVNDAPAGSDGTLTAVEDVVRVFTATDFGFSDASDTPANTLLSVVITTLPANGTIRFNGTAITAGQEFTVAQLAQLTYTAAANANGNAYTTFTFQVRDNGGTTNGGVDLDQSPNTITFNVTPVNDAPAGADATLTALEDVARVFTVADFGFSDASDSPANAFASVIITTLPANGTIRLNGVAITAGQEITAAQLPQLTFTAAANANGNAYTTFTFQVRDNGGTTNGGVDLDQSPNTITFNVTPVNDAPAGSDATLTAVEDVARVFTAADFGFSDANDTPANTLLSVIITTLPANGTIRLNGVAVTAGQEITVAQLPQLTFTAAANANGNAYTSLTFQVRDNGGTANGGVNLDQSPNTLTFNVTPVNDAPAGADTTLTAVEDTARVFTAADFGFSDTADTPANAFASVIITTLPANGTIRLNGVAVTAGQEITVAQFPQLTFTAVANANGNAYTAFTFQVRDNGGTTNGGVDLDQSPNTITFNVTPVNDAPAGADATLTAVEDVSRTFTVADFGFSDTADTPANTFASVIITTLPANGTIRLNGVAVTAGQEITAAQLPLLTFTAAANANGAAYTSFTFQVRDNSGTLNGGVDLDQSPNTITFNVTSVNDAPAGADATLTAVEDVARVFTVADFGFSDISDTPANTFASVIITTLPANGTIRLNGVAVTAGQEITVAQLPQLTFTAATNANGNAYASFTFQVRDGGGTANGGVDLDQSPNTITFNVTSVNDAPAGADATLTAVEDTARVFTAADFGFSDTSDTPANAFASVIITTLPANGTIRLNGVAVTSGQEITVAQFPQLTFTAAANANGNAYTTFTFQVRDGGGTANGGVDLDQSPNTITFNVTSVNDAPAGADATLTAVEDTARVFTAADFGFSDASDSPANAFASVIITTLPANGTIRLNGVAVTAGQEITVAQLPQLTFTAAANANGAAYTNFTFQVRDSGGTLNGGVDLDQSPNTITFNVTPVNDAPVGSDATLTAVEDTPRTFTVADFGFSDAADTPANAFASVVITTLPANGTIRLNGVAITAGQEITAAQLPQLTFTAAANANGAAYTSFTFQVRDNGGTLNGGVDLDQSPNTITFNVTSVNDAPAGADATLTAVEDVSRTFTVADFGFSDTADSPANAFASVIITTLPANGTIRLNGVAVTAGQEITAAQLPQLTFTAAANANGAVYTSFTFQVRDNGGTLNGGVDLDQSPNTITFNVTPVNDAPAGADATLTAVEDVARTFTVADFGFSDTSDSPANTFASVIITTLPANGTIRLNGVAVTAGQEITAAQLPLLTFTAAANANGNAYTSFTFQVRDNGGTLNGGVDLDQSPNTITFNVTPVNDAPAGADATLTAIEDTARVFTAADFGFSDANDTPANAFASVIITTLPTNGTIRFNGTPIAAGQEFTIAQLAQLTFTAAPDANGNAYATFTFQVRDGGGTLNGGVDLDQSPNTITFNVTPVNDNPVLSGTSTLAYTENQAATAIDANLLVSDVDNTTLASASVSIGAGFVSGEDVLGFTAQNGITGSYNAATGVLTLTGTATVAQYQTALRSVTYANSSDNPSTATRTVNYQVNDGQGANNLSNLQASTITVTAVNDAPTQVVPGAQTTAEDTPRAISGVTVADLDSNALTTTVSVLHGTISVTAGGGVVLTNNGTGTVTLQGTAAQINAALAGLTYSNTPDYNGADTLSVVTSDGALGSGTNTVAINVTPVVDIANDTATTLEDTLVNINVNANDSFENAGHTITAINGTTIAVNGSVAVANGTVTLRANGTLDFTPALNYNNAAPTTFTYTVTSGGVTETATVSVNVTPVNDAPVANPDVATTAINTPLVNVAVLANDTDVDGDTLTVSSATVPAAQGTVVVNGNGTLTFTPATNFTGTATITYNISDGNGGTASSMLTVNVGSNTPPDSADKTLTAIEDTVLTIATADFAFNDVDAGQTLAAVRINTLPANGTLRLNGVAVTANQVVLASDIAAGRLTFLPALNGNGNNYANFTFSVQDSAGAFDPTPNRITLNVTPVNDNPVANPDTGTTAINVALNNINVLGNDTDVDGDTLTVSTATVPAAQGTVTVNGNGTLNFTPATNFSGSATITYTISDGNGGTATGTLTVNVGANTPPDSANATVTTLEDTTLTLTNTNFAFTDADAGQTLAAVRIDTLPVSGSLRLNGVAVTAGQVISIANINAGNLRFVPALNGNGAAYANFNFSVQDSGGAFDATPNTITVNVTPVNDAPVAVNDTATTAEDTPLTLTPATLLANDSDVDGDTLTITSVQGAVNGSVAIVGGNVVFTPNADYFGPASFTYTVSDGNGGTATATVNITVTSVNDNPVANPDSGTTAINTVLNNINVLGNDTDVDGDTLTVSTATVPAAQGTVTINGNGTLNFTPATNFSGAATITYTISDGNGGTATGTLTVNVGANTPPNSANATVTTLEDTTLTFANANFAFTDADAGQTLAAVRVDTLPVNGSLRLNGVAVTAGQVITIANINAGNLRFVPALNGNGAAYATFNFSVQDSGGAFDTTPNTITVNVTSVNDAPVAVNDAATTAEDTPLTLTPATLLANDSDVDGDTFTITSVQGAVNGSVAIVGGNVVFTPNANYFGPASFTYTVSDGNGGTATATVNITVTSVNDAPVANPDSGSTAINVALNNINVLGNDTDVDGDTLTVSTATVPAAQGTVTVNGNGTLNFTPATNFSGPATITYTISDGNGGTATGTLTVTVGANTPPNSNNATVTTLEDTTLTFANANFAFTDADAGQTLAAVRIDTLPANGNLRLNGVAVTVGQIISVANINAGNLRFVPALNGNGAAYATFNFSVQDSGGAFDTTPNTITVNVTPVNDAPVAVNDSATTAEDTPLTLTTAALLGNDSDVDGDTLTITSVQGAVNGSVAIVGGNVVFTPNADYFGPASFTYTVSDGNGGTATATVNVTVTPVNDAPVANNDSASTAINTTLASINVLGNDTDVDGDTLTVQTATVPAAQGAVTVNGDGTLRFIPANNFSGPATITYTISDGNGGSATATVTVNVGANTPPNSANATLTTLEDTTLTLSNANFAFTDADAGQTLAAVRIDTLPANGTIRLNGIAVIAGQVVSIANINAGNLRFVPALNGNGTAYATFNFSVQDSGGAFDTTPNTITVNVTPVNDAPVAINDSATTAEDTPLTLTPATLLGNDSDVDGDTLSITSVQGAVNGAVAIVGGNVVFTPNANYFGPASFTYTISDGNGGTATATVNITVTSVNDNPVANNDTATTAINTTLASINVLGNDTDVDGDTLTVQTATVSAAQGTVTINGDGTLRFVPANNFSGPATITYTISDGNGGTATASVTVNVGANTPPDSANATVTTLEDTNFTFNNTHFAFTDSDAGQTLAAVRIDTLPANGSLRLNGVAVTAGQVISIANINAGNLRFVPVLNGNGAAYATFNFSVQDSGGAFDTTPNTITVNVTPVNDAPIAVNDTAATAEDTQLTLTPATLLGNDSDVDGDTLTITSVQGAVNGSVAIVGGNVVFTPNANYFGPASFTYTVSDGNGATSTATVNITVTSVNDAPVANNDTATTAINTTLTNINVLGNDTDVEGDTLTVQTATVPAAQGLVTINGDGTLRFVPASNFSGTATITYTINDGNGGTATATVTVNVGANTLPDSANATVTTVEDIAFTFTSANFPFADADAGQTLAAVRIDTLPANGTIRLNGVTVTAGQLVSIADINAGNLTFAPALNGNGTNYATFNFSVQDSAGGFDPTPNTIIVNVTPVNDAPVANNDSVNTAINSVLPNINVLGNDTDVDGDTLSVTSATVPAAQGTVTINGDGTLRFVPANNFSGPATITYTISDGNGGVATASVNVFVGVNTAPDSADTTVTFAEDTVLTFVPANFAFNDIDAGQTLSAVRIDTLPAVGTLRLNGVAVTAGQVVSAANIAAGNLTFTPLANGNGVSYTAFTFSVQDSAGAFDSNPNMLTFNVTPVNDNPTAVNDIATTAEDTPITFLTSTLLANDSDIDGDTVSLTSVQGAVNGTVSLVGGNVVFTPNANYFGPASFTYTISDSNGGTATATVNLTITSVNDAPIAVNDSATTAEDTPLTLTPGALLGNDSDVDGDTLTIASVQGAVNGTVTLVGGNVVFTPNADYNGPASFTYTVSDGNGGTATATVNITVTPVNDNPVANNDTAATPVNTPTAPLNVLQNDTDVDGDTLTVTSASVPPARGTVVVNADNTLTFTPATNVSGPATITYTISDGKGGTATATLTVNVGNNTPPNSVDATVTINEDTTLTFSAGSFAFNDPDAGQTLVAVRVDTLPANGTIRLNGVAVTAGQVISIADVSAGNLRFVPALNGNGAAYATFNFSVQDSGGAFDTTPNTITVNVTPVNDAPVAVNDSATTAEDTPLTLTPATLLGNDSDVDGDTLTITSVQGAVNGSVALVGGNVVFTPNSNFNGVASFTYTVTDGNGGTSTATVSITVTPVNDNPVANSDTASTPVNTPANNIVVLANDTDVDGDTISVTGASVPLAEGTVTVNPNGTLNFTPATNFSGSATITYSIADGNGGTATGTLTVNVGANTPPNGASVTSVIDEDTTITFSPGSFIFTDPDAGQTLIAVRIDTLPTRGTMTYDGVPITAGFVISVADLNTSRLQYTPLANESGVPYAVFTYSVQDSAGAFDTNPDAYGIQVLPLNDAPVVAGGGTVTYTENQAPLAVSPGLMVSDIDNTTLASATVSIGSGFVSGQDILGFTAQNGITGSYDSATGVLTLTGTATVAQYQTALRSVTYANTSDNPSGAPRTVTFAVNDGESVYSQSNSHPSIVNVVPVNDNPVANADVASTAINTPANNINVLANDTDAEGDTLTVTSATVPVAQGTVTVNGNGTLNFTPANNFSGTATVSYVISDGHGGTATGTLTVTVGANTPPNSADTTIAATEDTAVVLSTGDFAFTDADAGQTLAGVRIDTLPANGTLRLNGVAVTAGQVISASNIATGNLTFVPGLNGNGANYANFTFSVQDSGGAFDTTPNRITFNVAAVNDAPVATNDTVTTPEDSVLTLSPASLLANDSDVDGDTLTITSVQGAVNGTVAIVGGNVVFTPNANYFGPASFTYTVSDGNGATATATVNIAVTSVNDAPVANPDTASTPINATLNNINVLGNDTDVDGDTLTVQTAMVAAAQGTVTINGDGTLRFTPVVNFTGAATITYTISDGNGGTATGTLTVNVGNNTAPTSTDDTLDGTEDTPFVLTTSNFAFIDADAGQTLAGVRIDTLPANGTLRLNGVAVTAGQVVSASNIAAGNLTFVPGLNGNGTSYANFTFSVQDSGGAFDTTPNRITFNVAAVNDAPVAVNDTVATAEDTPLTLSPAALLGNDSDVDGDTLTITSVQGAVNGTVALVGGNIVFTPNANYNGPASFTYTVSDSNGGTATATVSINVTAVNDVPVANNDVASTAINTTVSNINVLANDTDVEGDTLSVTGATVNPAQGAVSVNGDGTLNFTPALNFTGVATVTYTISDGNGGNATGTLTINVGTNNPPTSANATVAGTEDTPLALTTGNFAFNDVDAGQTLANVRIDSIPANGSLQLNGVIIGAGQIVSAADIAAGRLVFVPGANGNGNNYASFSFSVQDSAGAFAAAPSVITLNVAAVNDAPVANPDTVTTPEDSVLTLSPATLLGNDTDVDGDTLSIVSVQGAVGGTVAIVGGNVVFTPFANFNGAASFTYTVSDGKGGTATATVNVNVTPVDDPLSGDLSHDAANDTGSSPNDGITRNNSPAITGTSTPGDTITLYAPDGVTVLGTTVVDAQGNWSIDPNGPYLTEGVNNLSVRATDPNGNQSAAAPVQVVLDTTPTAAPNVIITEDTNGDGIISATESVGPVNVDIVLPSDAKPGDILRVTDGTTVNIIVLAASDIANGKVTSAFPNPGEGIVITVSANITDVAGNVSVSSSASATMFTTPLVANPDHVTASPRDPLVLDPAALLANDTAAPGSTIALVSVQDGVNGTVALVNGHIVFTPAPGFFGAASFTYTVSDGNGQMSTSSVSVTVLADDVRIEPARPIDNPRVEIAPWNPVIDHALHVEHSVDVARAETSLRSGMGVFVTDGATFAELSSEQATRLDSLVPAIPDSLFVQHAVRQESITTDPTLFVQTSVRSSQLESLARNVRIDSVNSATPGVSTLLDPFALGSPSGMDATKLALDAERSKIDDEATIAQKAKDDAARVARPVQPVDVSQDVRVQDTAVLPVKRRAADGFASQLRQNANSLRQNALRPETRPNQGHTPVKGAQKS